MHHMEFSGQQMAALRDLTGLTGEDDREPTPDDILLVLAADAILRDELARLGLAADD